MCMVLVEANETTDQASSWLLQRWSAVGPCTGCSRMEHLEPALQWGPWECLSEVLARWRVQGVRAAFPVEGYSGEMNNTQNAVWLWMACVSAEHGKDFGFKSRHWERLGKRVTQVSLCRSHLSCRTFQKRITWVQCPFLCTQPCLCTWPSLAYTWKGRLHSTAGEWCPSSVTPPGPWASLEWTHSGSTSTNSPTPPALFHLLGMIIIAIFITVTCASLANLTS